MKTCFETMLADFPIRLEQRADGTFSVTYGAQKKDRLCYETASVELGSAIMHAAACEGRLDYDYD